LATSPRNETTVGRAICSERPALWCERSAYLRASTDEQDANRARDQLKAFAVERGLTIVAWYTENESGAKLARPELFRLLADACDGDILLVEQVDRLSRPTSGDWEKLKAEINARHIRVAALDLPTSWMMAAKADEFTGRMFAAINSMLLDMLAAVARKDYDDRRRQAQGQAKAQAAGLYKGRAEDTERNAGIASMLAAGQSWSARPPRAAAAQPLRRSPSGPSKPRKATLGQFDCGGGCT
jgi:DNA invertase Pin-like site-specific DNA recombinase